MSKPVTYNHINIQPERKESYKEMYEKAYKVIESVLEGSYEIYQKTQSKEAVGEYILKLHRTYTAQIAKEELMK